jgi:hypothetical protein
MQPFSQLTIHGKICPVASYPLPMDLLPIVRVYAPYNGEIFKVRSPVGNFPDKSKRSLFGTLFGTPRDRRGPRYIQGKHECKNSERNQGSKQISKPFINV